MRRVFTPPPYPLARYSPNGPSHTHEGLRVGGMGRVSSPLNIPVGSP